MRTLELVVANLMIKYFLTLDKFDEIYIFAKHVDRHF